MQYRELGLTGLKTSVIGLGSWLTFEATDGGKEAEFRRCVAKAFDSGVNHFDTADMYAGGEAECLLGRALSDRDRGDYILTSKCFQPRSEAVTNRGLTRKHIVESVHRSLRNFGTDHIDIYLCHRFDEATPLVETVRTFEDLIRAGKVLYWGVSRWTVGQLEQARRLAAEAYRPMMVQSPYNLLWRGEEGMIDYCHHNNVGFVCYSPLAQGALTGKYLDGIPPQSRAGLGLAHTMQNYLTEDNARRVRQLKAIAAQHKVALPALALAWCLKKPGVSCAMTGVTSMTQLETNLEAAELALTDGLYTEAQAA